MEEQSDTPRTEMAEGQGLNPYFEGRFDGESDELCALRLTLARERDEARAEIERMRGALRGLHDDIVEYQRINHLGGYDNHWMLAARAALTATEAKP